MYKIVLADGTSVGFYVANATCSSNTNVSSYCGPIWIDIDGSTKGSGTVGKDFFLFYVTKNGILPAGGKDDANTNTDALLKTNCFTTGRYCTGYIIDNDNIDYLKANNGTCPNGTVLSWSNTTCK